MLRDAQATRKRKGRPEKYRRSVRFPGLLNDAQALGVHRNHLYLVLSGRRISASLTQRYQQLKSPK